MDKLWQFYKTGMRRKGSVLLINMDYVFTHYSVLICLLDNSQDCNYRYRGRLWIFGRRFCLTL